MSRLAAEAEESPDFVRPLKAPRLSPSASPVDPSILPGLELPPLAYHEDSAGEPAGQYDDLTLDEQVANVASHSFCFGLPQETSTPSTSTSESPGPSLPEGASLMQGFLFPLGQMEPLASPPKELGAQPAAPPADIFPVPDISPPPWAEFAQMSIADPRKDAEMQLVQTHGVVLARGSVGNPGEDTGFEALPLLSLCSEGRDIML